MASSRDVGGPRHVGRVIDPSARDDGVDEPELHLDLGAPAPTQSPTEALPRSSGAASESSIIYEENDLETANAPSSPNEEGDPAAVAGHPVRDRLLARAAAARRLRGGGVEPPSSPDHESSGPFDESPLATIEQELELVASGPHRPPAAPPARPGRAPLSANAVAVFGTLFGLAAVASLFAILIHLDPREPARPSAVTPPSGEEAPHPEPDEAAPTSERSEQRPKKRQRKRLPGPWRIADSKDPSLKVIEGTIGREPFLRAVQDAGLPRDQAYRVLTALKDLRNLDKCGHTDRFAALIDRSTSRVNAFEYVVTDEEVYQAREGDDGLLRGEQLDLKVGRERVQGAVLVGADGFEESAERAGFERGLGKVVDGALTGHTSLSQVKAGDRFRIVVQEVTVLGEFSRYAGVETLEYLPVDGDEPLRIYYFRGPESKGYFDARGRSPSSGGWRKPVADAPITSHFNPKRMHPVLKKVMPHNGTDFGAPSGTPVGAASYGTVQFIGYSGPSGNLVLIDHPGGIQTGYAHLSRFEPGLKVGDKVSRLQVIGYVGTTGRSTGPHLHFSVKKNGEFIDPLSLKLDALQVLPKNERAVFAEAREKYDALLEAIPLPEPPRQPPPQAAAAAEPDEPPDEVGDDEELDRPPPATARAPSSAALPEDRSATPPAEAPPAPARQTSAIYLTDLELMKLQGRVDHGEVAE